MCSGQATKSCGVCRERRYCDVKCQKLDWPVHKQTCKKMRTVSSQDSEDCVVATKVMNLRNQCTQCNCTKCASLCNSIPGPMDPFHVQEMLKKNPAFYATCVEDYNFTDNLSPVFYLRPPMTSETPGTRAKFSITRGTCSYLTDRGCSFSLADRPLGCAVVKGCEKDSRRADKAEASWIWTTSTGLARYSRFRDLQWKTRNSIS
jgi:hypothetical protein